MAVFDRRRFLCTSASLAAVGVLPAALSRAQPASGRKPDMQFGLVTYMWGADWDLPTLIANCEKAGALGVELRTTHKHGVEPSLTAQQRLEVKQRFADSPVTLVGLGSAEDFHDVDPKSLKDSIETTKAFLKLSHDVGGSGVKVRPNDLPKEVAKKQTIEQIGRSLNEVAAYGADYGQQIRVEVHGGKTSPLPIIAAIMEVADHPNVGVCWNCNPQDLEGEGIAHNFGLVKDRLGATTHVHGLATDDYPYTELFALLKEANYEGWILEEASSSPADRVTALAQERAAFDALVR